MIQKCKESCGINHPIKQIKRYRYSPSYKAETTENWLSEMSRCGWKLTECRFNFLYQFVESDEQVEYFIFRTDRKCYYDPTRDCIDSVDTIVKTRYQKEHDNVHTFFGNYIYMIDLDKVDEFYNYYKSIRDEYIYKLRRNETFIFLVSLLFWIVCAFWGYGMSYFWIIISFLGVLYNAVGLIYMKKYNSNIF